MSTATTSKRAQKTQAESEDRFCIFGATYFAVETGSLRCDGCEFEKLDCGKLKIPPCRGDARRDGVDVVFVAKVKRAAGKIHYLKIREEYASAKLAGKKFFEVRVNDRDFRVGDIVQYIAVDDGGAAKYHPISTLAYKITFIVRSIGMRKGYVAFGERIAELPKTDRHFETENYEPEN